MREPVKPVTVHEVEEIPEPIEVVKIEPAMKRSKIKEVKEIEVVVKEEPKKESVKEEKKAQQSKKVEDILPVSTPAKAFARDVKADFLQKAAENKSEPIQLMADGPAANIQGINRAMKAPAARMPRALGKERKN